MKKSFIRNTGFAAVAIIAFLNTSCKKTAEFTSFKQGEWSDTSGTLKSLASFPIGMAMQYGVGNTVPAYFNTAKREVGWVTFENELKNNAVVTANGTYNFTTADAFYDKATAAGLQVFGHTLVWHSQQRANIYNAIVGGGGSTAPNLIVNPGFENVTGSNGDVADGWQVLNGSGQFVIAAGGNVNAGTKALQANVPAGGQNYNTQIVTRTPIAVTAGTTYNFSYFIKGASAQNIQFELRYSNGSVSYQGGKAVTTSYSKVSNDFTIPAGVTTVQIAFDLGGTANTIYIDDVSFTDATPVVLPNPAQITAAVDAAMKNHIETVVNHYKGKIKAWDVINEAFAEDGTLRNNNNTTLGADVFVWQNYLGRAFAEKAFRYTNAADPAAELYINDYNLETSTAKLNGFVTLAKELKANGVPITGVGTQMHINVSTPYAGIDAAFKALASTGLKVRISELDVRANVPNAPTYTLDAGTANLQASMYKYAIWSYYKNVPAAQRGGITFWGVSDTYSWLNTTARPDAPLLFDANYQKKPAYAGAKQSLQGKEIQDY